MRIFTLIFCFLISSLSFAQGTKIEGSVLDGEFNKEPLAFANVSVKGLDINAETSMNGDFKLNLLEGKYTLVIDFVGYEAIEIKDVIVSNIDIKLHPVVLSSLKRSYDMASTTNEE